MDPVSQIWMLIDIVHKASAAGPNYAWIKVMADEGLAEVKKQMEKAKSESTSGIEDIPSEQNPSTIRRL